MLRIPTALSVARTPRSDATRRKSSGGTDGSDGAVFDTVMSSCALVAAVGRGTSSVGAICATSGSVIATGADVTPGAALGSVTGTCCTTVCGAVLGTATGVGLAPGLGTVEVVPPPQAAKVAAATTAEKTAIGRA